MKTATKMNCLLLLFFIINAGYAQQPTPLMGWMSWNLHELKISEKLINNTADYLVQVYKTILLKISKTLLKN